MSVSNKEDGMNITEETKLVDLLLEYPWLKKELQEIDGRFKLLESPLGHMLAKKATIGDMSSRSGIDADELIQKIDERIRNHTLE